MLAELGKKLSQEQGQEPLQALRNMRKFVAEHAGSNKSTDIAMVQLYNKVLTEAAQFERQEKCGGSAYYEKNEAWILAETENIRKRAALKGMDAEQLERKKNDMLRFLEEHSKESLIQRIQQVQDIGTSVTDEQEIAQILAGIHYDGVIHDLYAMVLGCMKKLDEQEQYQGIRHLGENLALLEKIEQRIKQKYAMQMAISDCI